MNHIKCNSQAHVRGLSSWSRYGVSHSDLRLPGDVLSIQKSAPSLSTSPSTQEALSSLSHGHAELQLLRAVDI